MAEPPILDWSSGAPRSAAFDDGYFASGDGLAESRAVFLAGLGLPDAWAGRDRFTLGELGFGTGLNILGLLQLWRDHRPSPTARLHLFSVEAFPLAPADAARALGAWPELADLAAPLLARWPRGRVGPHRFEWPDLGATLDLLIGEALAGVEGWAGRADGWLLDGFAPSRNPQMWRPELLAAVAARSRPGARAATFTVAGYVRRALELAGFTVAKRPGHGRKRERLEARRSGEPPPDPVRPRVAVIGAGIAGAALARALARQGLEVAVFAGAPDASLNSAALVTPRLDAGLGLIARLSAVAFARAADLYAAEPAAVISRGVLRLESGARDGHRFRLIAGWEGFDPGALAVRRSEEVARALGEPTAPGALEESEALVVEPAAVLRAWLAGTPVRSAEVARVTNEGGAWSLHDEGERKLGEADALVLAGGAAGAGLLPQAPLRPTRGQVQTVEAVDPGPATAWGAYAVPTRSGLLFGATHGRGDEGADVRTADWEANLAALDAARPELAALVRAAPGSTRGGRAGVRAATPDHLPLAGAVPGRPGVWTLTALGGRGFTHAPLLAEHVAALIADAPSPLPCDLAPLVDPARFGAGTSPARPRSGSTKPPEEPE